MDGRGYVVPGYENGNFVGPTILTNVTVRIFLLCFLPHRFKLENYFFYDPKSHIQQFFENALREMIITIFLLENILVRNLWCQLNVLPLKMSQYFSLKGFLLTIFFF